MAPRVAEDRELLAAIPVAPQWAHLAAGAFVGGGASALWWLILGVVGASWPATVRSVYFPLLQRLQGWHGWSLAIVCLVVLIGWGVVAREVAASAGLL